MVAGKPRSTYVKLYRSAPPGGIEADPVADYSAGIMPRSGKRLVGQAHRQLQLKALEKAAGSWKDEHHPEIKEGARKWVARLRSESDRRRSGPFESAHPGIL
ncbi:MAG: hypothetical protein ACREQI_03615 [Candidatus Binataceae bacterium]